MTILKQKQIKVCICTCGKEENKYIREFVEYYKNYGVDKIFLYDNNNKNGEHFEDVLQDYISDNFVSIINYRGKKKIQMKAFGHCYLKNKFDYDWFIFYDIDEFIYLHNYNNIKNYLIQKQFNKCDIIYLNNIIHTDNNNIYYYNKSLFQRFPQIENFNNINKRYKPRYLLVDLTKIIIRSQIPGVKFTNPHILKYNMNNNCNGFGKLIKRKSIHLDKPDHKYFYFHHFYFKSSEEYLKKLNVGSVFFGRKRGYKLFNFQLYFAINEITSDKLDYFEIKTGINMSYFREKKKIKK